MTNRLVFPPYISCSRHEGHGLTRKTSEILQTR